MEPMALGSAPGSPSSPSANPNYLPAFLMGNAKPVSPNSPELRKNISFNLTPSDRSSMRQKLFSPSVSDVPKHLPPSVESNTTPGPPRQSLFDTLDVRRSINTTTPTPNTQNSFQHDSFSHSFNEKSVERPEIIRQATAGSNLWVTVFGFPTTASGSIFTQFASCGMIADKRFPAQGNWMHLKFSNTLEVSKALSLNGKLILNSIMIGVLPYQNNSIRESGESPMPKTPTRARSLRLSFVSPQNSNMVITPENVPQKSTGILTKAMDYVLGW